MQEQAKNQYKNCIIFFIIFIIIYCSYFMFTGLYTVYVYIPSSFFTIESPLGGSLFLALGHKFAYTYFIK